MNFTWPLFEPYIYVIRTKGWDIIDWWISAKNANFPNQESFLSSIFHKCKNGMFSHSFVTLEGHNLCHGRFSFVLKDLCSFALSYVLNPEGTSDLWNWKKKIGFYFQDFDGTRRNRGLAIMFELSPLSYIIEGVENHYSLKAH